MPWCSAAGRGRAEHRRNDSPRPTAQRRRPAPERLPPHSVTPIASPRAGACQTPNERQRRKTGARTGTPGRTKMWKASGWVDGRESFATVNPLQRDKIRINGHIAGFESYAMISKVNAKEWRVAGSIGGHDSHATITKTGRGEWRVWGRVCGRESMLALTTICDGQYRLTEQTGASGTTLTIRRL